MMQTVYCEEMHKQRQYYIIAQPNLPYDYIWQSYAAKYCEFKSKWI